MVAMSRQAEAPRRHFLLRAASFTTRRVLSLITWSPCSTIGASANLDSLVDTVQVVLEAFHRFCGRFFSYARNDRDSESFPVFLVCWCALRRSGSCAPRRTKMLSCDSYNSKTLFGVCSVFGGSWRFGRYALSGRRIPSGGFCASGGMGIPCGFGRGIRDSLALCKRPTSMDVGRGAVRIVGGSFVRSSISLRKRPASMDAGRNAVRIVGAD